MRRAALALALWLGGCSWIIGQPITDDGGAGDLAGAAGGDGGGVGDGGSNPACVLGPPVLLYMGSPGYPGEIVDVAAKPTGAVMVWVDNNQRLTAVHTSSITAPVSLMPSGANVCTSPRAAAGAATQPLLAGGVCWNATSLSGFELAYGWTVDPSPTVPALVAQTNCGMVGTTKRFMGVGYDGATPVVVGCGTNLSAGAPGPTDQSLGLAGVSAVRTASGRLGVLTAFHVANDDLHVGTLNFTGGMFKLTQVSTGWGLAAAPGGLTIAPAVIGGGQLMAAVVGSDVLVAAPGAAPQKLGVDAVATARTPVGLVALPDGTYVLAVTSSTKTMSLVRLAADGSKLSADPFASPQHAAAPPSLAYGLGKLYAAFPQDGTGAAILMDVDVSCR